MLNKLFRFERFVNENYLFNVKMSIKMTIAPASLMINQKQFPALKIYACVCVFV